MLNIAVVGESNVKGGGSYHQSSKIHKILSNLREFSFKFLLINSNNDAIKFEKNIIFYNVNFIDKLFFLFYSSKFIKAILKKLRIQNRFKKFLLRNNIDLVIFLGNSRLSLFCKNINYITYIYEFHHILRPDLPEYKEWNDFDFREDLLIENIKKSLLLIVDTQKKAKDLVKYYNCFDDKIAVVPLSSDLTENKNHKNIKISSNVSKLLNGDKNFFFYPAQYWSHKNHYYILCALQLLKLNYNKSAKFVFTGSKKNNYEFLLKKRNEFKLDKEITFFEYLNDEDIKELYKNCKGVVMPSLIGYSSLPLYEAFFFKKPVFYTKDLLDVSLQKFVNQIDILQPKSLAIALNNFDKNIEEINYKVDSAKVFFDNNLSQVQIENQYKKILKKIQNQISIYK
tara:strand:- start:5692 stop:6882 length:1191 start_codon:yes stop_codon:yes gene_type:complete